MSEYEALVADMKNLTQNGVTLPMAEDEWYTRPDEVSYGTVSLDFEADALEGNDLKQDTAYSGSVDLFSMVRGGAGWIPLIKGVLEEHCGACWSLNSHQYERETGLFHWEWIFQITDEEAGED